MFAIGVFHFVEAVYYQSHDFFPKDEASFLFVFPLAVARSFSISGFVIVCLTTFLMGFSGSFKKLRLSHLYVFLILFFGAFVFLPLYWGEGQWAFEWDIYQYFLLVLLILYFVDKLDEKLKIFLAGLGFLMLWIPFWKLEPHILDWPLVGVLIGQCLQEETGTWPIFPWVGLGLMAFVLGNYAKKFRQNLSVFHKKEFLYLPLLGLGVLTWGTYYSVDIGSGFYCFMNRQHPLLFWGHMIWILWLIRVSMLTKVNSILSKTAFIKNLGQLYLSKNFALFYLVQLMVVGVYSYIPILKQNSFIAGVFILSVLPVTELILQTFALLHKTFKRS